MKIGEVWLFKEQWRYCVYDEPTRSFYEKFEIDGPSTFIVLETFRLNGILHSAEVLTENGVGWISVGSYDYNEYRYVQIK